MLGELTNNGHINDGDQKSSLGKPLIGIGLDSCVLPLKYDGLSLVQTTDFFYPLIDDPYTMGRIACCNVLSDLYAMGVEECDNLLMLLGVSEAMTEHEKKVIMPLIIRGFRECAIEAGSDVQGGQTVMNPWLIIGGVATTVCPTTSIVMPHHAQPGDLLVLTKPLGTQVAVNAYQWMEDRRPKYESIKAIVSDHQIEALFESATSHMATLNRRAARAMHKHGARGCTDVTGFGLLGHAANLAEAQTAEVDLVIDTLPCLRHACEIDDAVDGTFKLRRGLSAETSGGLLVVLGPEEAAAFIEGFGGAWIVGRVVPGARRARLAAEVAVISV